MTDTLLITTAMDISIKNLGIIEAERFITLILKEPFDYTEWRKKFLSGETSVEEVNKQAKEYWYNLQPEAAQ